MNYSPLFHLELSHGYYPEGRCPDLVLAPTPSCQRVARGHRLGLKVTADRLTVLVPLGAGDIPLVPLAASLTWTFVLIRNNPQFACITQLDRDYQPSRHLYWYRSNAVAADLVPVSSARTAPEAIAVLTELSLQQRQAVFGIIKIARSDLEIGQPRNFSIAFAPRESIWTYYLVTPKTTPAGQFAIRDFKEKIAFTPFAKATPGDPMATELRVCFPESQAWVSQSSQPIAYRESGLPDLQLIADGQTQQPWIAHLPNPPANRGTQVVSILPQM